MDASPLTPLIDLLAGRSTLALDEAALRLATVEFPTLRIGDCIHTLDVMAEEVGRRTSHASHGREFIEAANAFLFHELGLRGNSDNYHDPHNSCLNHVLSRREGIPITLSVLYMEIARRLGRPVFGVGLPNHFVIQYDDGQYAAFVDPFHGGMILSTDQCYDLAGMKVPDASVLKPIGTPRIIFRMISNLRSIYFSRRSYRKALQVVDVLIGAVPDIADHYKQRGLLHYRLGKIRASRADFEQYLALEPKAEDRDEIAEQIKGLNRLLANMN